MLALEVTSWDHMLAADVPLLPGWSGSVGAVVSGLSGVGKAIQNPATLDYRWVGTYDSILIQCRFRADNTSVEREILGIYTANNLQIRLKHNNHGVAIVETGASGAGSFVSVPTVFLQQAVYLLEFIVYLHDSAGKFTVRVNGKNVADLNVGNIDTKGYSGTPDRVRLNNPAGTYDDFMVRGGTGGYSGVDFVTDKFLNPRYATWLPIGRGALEQWNIVSGSGEHWEWIDDPEMDGTATELTTGLSGALESWVLPSLPIETARVRDISTVYAVRATAGAPRVRHFLRLGGVNYLHADATSPMQLTYDFEWRHWPSDPATGLGWQINVANDLQAGIMREAPSNGELTRITQAAVVVTYEVGSQVTQETPTPVDVFDLVGTGGSGERVEFMELGGGESHTAHLGYRTDPRAVERFVVAIQPAKSAEIFRAENLWTKSAYGVLPLLWPESVHGLGIGDVLVTIDQPQLRIDLENPEWGSVRVILRRWRA